jgi:hypothetical protein
MSLALLAVFKKKAVLLEDPNNHAGHTSMGRESHGLSFPQVEKDKLDKP